MQITPRVRALRIPFRIPTSPQASVDRFVYAYVLLGTRTALLDTGVSGSAEALVQLLLAQGRPPASIDRFIPTHGHVDHMGSAKALQDMTGARVLANPAERTWIEDIEIQARETGRGGSRPSGSFGIVRGNTLGTRPAPDYGQSPRGQVSLGSLSNARYAIAVVSE